MRKSLKHSFPSALAGRLREHCPICRHTKEATSVELERGARLRQPEISLSMKLLEERGWITEPEEKKRGKGRPYKIYSLNIGFDELIDQMEAHQKKANDDAQAKIERLKELRK